MTLPANDAFTLALSHSESPSRRTSRSRSITRSPSPKIAFATSSSHVHPHPHPHANGDAKRRPGARRRVSKSTGGEAGKEALAEIDEADDALEVEQRLLNGHGDGTAGKKDKADSGAGKKVDWEIPRKTLHSSIGFLTLWLYTSHGSPQRVVVCLAGALCVIVPADALRLYSPRFARMYERFLGFLMRESEKKTTNGVIWYIIGVLFVLTLYPLDIAVMSIMILSWADTAASTFGRLWGKLTPALPSRLFGLPLAPRKSMAGFIAAVVTGFAIAIAFWASIADGRVSYDWTRGVVGEGRDTSAVGAAVRAWLREAGWQPVQVAGWVGLGLVGAVAGVVTGIAEALDLGSLDDNLTLPIISGGCIWGFLKLLSWFSS
ncbi:hypothetical protein DENSPDRAFT_841066 [Dentipellis sp. KUC8613]|nr:hypothetical protein DENSPDRAFT_841066 [Dentipellis sp. KUC8613]